MGTNYHLVCVQFDPYALHFNKQYLQQYGKNLLRPSLDPVKINSILRYLERSKSLEVDLHGNIIWIRQEGEEKSNQSTLADVATISKDILIHFSTKGQKGNKEKLK